MQSNKITDALLGVVVGVPFEFRSRAEMQMNPATEMTGYGTYNQAQGTWSDDTEVVITGHFK